MKREHARPMRRLARATRTVWSWSDHVPPVSSRRATRAVSANRSERGGERQTFDDVRPREASRVRDGVRQRMWMTARTIVIGRS
jgi:hypothetical protein